VIRSEFRSLFQVFLRLPGLAKVAQRHAQVIQDVRIIRVTAEDEFQERHRLWILSLFPPGYNLIEEINAAGAGLPCDMNLLFINQYPGASLKPLKLGLEEAVDGFLESGGIRAARIWGEEGDIEIFYRDGEGVLCLGRHGTGYLPALYGVHSYQPERFRALAHASTNSLSLSGVAGTLLKMPSKTFPFFCLPVALYGRAICGISR